METGVPGRFEGNGIKVGSDQDWYPRGEFEMTTGGETMTEIGVEVERDPVLTATGVGRGTRTCVGGT